MNHNQFIVPYLISQKNILMVDSFITECNRKLCEFKQVILKAKSINRTTTNFGIRMYYFIAHLFLFFLLTGTWCAQAQKKNFSMAEAVNGMSTKFAVKNLKQLQWMGGNDMYSYVTNTDSDKAIYMVSPLNFESKKLATLDMLNTALSPLGINSMTSIPAISFKSQNTFFFNTENKWVECNSNGGVLNAEIIATLPEKADPIIIDTNKMSIAFVANDNLYVNYRNGAPMQITKDGSRTIVYGDSIHRNEFGIDHCIFWSPAGNYLAFYRMDQSMVEDYPLVNWSETPATVTQIKYPFAGRTSHQVTLGVFDCKTGKTIYLKTGEPKDQYLTTVTWSPDEKYVYVSLLNRAQNHLWLNRYDANSGEFVKTLFEETNDKYVEPQHPLYFPSNNPNLFYWWSQRDGYMHLYAYQNDSLQKQLTAGNWIVNELLGINKKSNELIFTSSKESPMQKNVYAVNLNNQMIRSVSTTMGIHTAQLSPSGTYLLDQIVNRNIPRAIEVTNLNTRLEKRIFTAPNTIEEYNTARVELVNLNALDGTPLIGKIIYPIDFDSTKKYPTIVYLYNGPHVQLNKDAFPFSGNLWYDYMAQKGYVMFVMDGRGSSNRGFAFESATYHQLGTVEMEDQLVGVSYLKSLPFVDANRLGVHGWSFGGFMTTSLMLRHPGIFKCAVAGGPVMDWSMYEVMYTERYMGTPQNNSEAYKTSRLIDKVKNLQGKLLLIHGTNDDTVVWEQSMQFIKKSVDEGVQVDYFVYPGHPHNVRGKDRVHLMQKISDYFDANLK